MNHHHDKPRRARVARILGVTGPLLLAAFALATPATTFAAVTGVGDVVPYITIPDPDGPGPLGPQDVPDLPQFGGNVNGGILVVGGTGGNSGMPVGGTDAGQVTISSPNDTDPLNATQVFLAGNPLVADIGFGQGQGQISIAGLNSALRISAVGLPTSQPNTYGLTVGTRGQAFLDIASGARVVPGDINGENTGLLNQLVASIGDQNGAQGFVTVNGFGSLFKSQNLFVGREGYGSMIVSNRGRVDTRLDAIIGVDQISGVSNAFGEGNVQLSGVGTRWNVGDTTINSNVAADLIVGALGRGTMQIDTGAWARVNHDVYLGQSVGGYGKTVVTGLGSKLWALRNLYVGASSSGATTGAGILEIGSGATVEADGSGSSTSIFVGALSFVEMGGGTLLGPATVNNGVIRGDGRVESAVTNNYYIRNAAGIANTRERLYFTGPVINNNVIESIGGEMEFASVVTNNNFIHGKNAVFYFNGGVVGGGDLVLDNTVAWFPGSSPAVVANAVYIGANDSSAVFADSFTMTGDVHVSVGQSWSLLEVSGDINLNTNRLFLDFNSSVVGQNDGYVPTVGDAFEILRGASLTGTFAMPVLPDKNFAGIGWTVDYTSTSAILRAVASAFTPMGADANGNGVVDAGDLAIIIANQGAPPPPVSAATGDANNDGVVDGADILEWQRKVGGPPSVAAAGAVPEPASLALAGFAIAALSLRRRTSR